MSSVVSPIKLVPSDRSEPRVNIVEKTDEEILAMANSLWRGLLTDRKSTRLNSSHQ